MDLKHIMAKNFTIIPAMIRKMKVTGYYLTDKKQVLAIIRSLLESSWGQVKLVLTHNEAIKTFDGISHHLELQAEQRNMSRNTVALVAQNGLKCGGFKRNKGKTKIQEL